MRKIVLYSLLFIIYFLFLPVDSSVLAQEKIINLYADIEIKESGVITVKETIIYDFDYEDRHGIFRNIPYTKENRDNKKFKLDFSNFSVVDETGQGYKFTQSKQNNEIILKIGDPDKTITGIHTYIINYQVSGALAYFSDHDEFYWDVVGGGWPVAIEQSSTTIALPTNITSSNITAACYSGDYGDKEHKCNFKISKNKVYFSLDQKLDARQYLTIVVGFPKNIVALLEPEPVVYFWETLIGKIVIGALLILGLLWYLLLPIWIIIKWYQHGRDPSVGPAVTAYYDPPKTQSNRRLSPAETGGLVDETVDFRDFVATLIDLAKRGYFTIVEKKKKDFYLVKKDVLPKKDQLLKYESRIIDSFFKDNKKEFRLKNYSSYITYADFSKDIYQLLVKESFFPKNPSSIRQKYYILAGIGGFTLNFFLLIIAVLFGKNMPAKTLTGAQEANKAKGLLNFLKSQDRHFEFLSKFDSDYQLGKQFVFEKFLPYAVAFGVEKQWAKKFKDILIHQPDWYQSKYMTRFNSTVFASNIGSSLSSSLYTPTSTTSTSGFSSGFSSSGGFSGGGGGGGGGGSW